MAMSDETKKGPWTEQEDVQLVLYVNLFGERRWDFIAKVSGLKRTGKSCRLRWVNYLNPGLKRGKLTPGEEKLVLELHSKWGNRWSRIARKLPGRTDNEIKNYWRTHVRKVAQEKKKKATTTSSPSSSSSSSSLGTVRTDPSMEDPPSTEAGERGFYDTSGMDFHAESEKKRKNQLGLDAEDGSSTQSLLVSMDEIWRNLDFNEKSPGFNSMATVASPIWDYCPDDYLWGSTDEEVSKTTLIQPAAAAADHQFHSFPFYKNQIICKL